MILNSEKKISVNWRLFTILKSKDKISNKAKGFRIDSLGKAKYSPAGLVFISNNFWRVLLVMQVKVEMDMLVLVMIVVQMVMMV